MPWDRPAVRAWPSRWLTATKGRSCAKEMALPLIRPIMTPPSRPGPEVAATRFRSS